MNDYKCISCNSKMRIIFPGWILYCKKCGLRRLLNVDSKQDINFDEKLYVSAHEKQRKVLFNDLINMMHKTGSIKNKKILDVGCSLGWFMEILNNYDGKSFGIDNEKKFIKSAYNNGHKVVVSEFPNTPFKNSFFDWIIFNDVFEHLKNLDSAINEIKNLLNENGMVLLFVPNKNSLIYLVSEILAKFGYHKPLERLWLKHYPFPHQTYFTRKNLSKLMKKNGFIEVSYDYKSYTSTVNIKSLMKIVKIDNSIGVIQALVLSIGLTVIRPISKILGPDSFICIYKKE